MNGERRFRDARSFYLDTLKSDVFHGVIRVNAPQDPAVLSSGRIVSHLRLSAQEYASALFSAASSLAQRGFASNYTLHSQQQSSSTSTSASTRPLYVGVWKVERATHNGPSKKQVSIWTCDKQQLVQHNSRQSVSSASRHDLVTKRLERAVEVLKKDAASLSRLRHPCILEMTEPVEETRSTISFATEPVTACLRHSISTSGSSKNANELELDEVEIQKGLSQIGKGLQFLHESAKLVHGNLTPDAVVINDKGDWKLAGFGLSTYLFGPSGAPAKWEFPELDHALPSAVQRDYDFIAPEYILDETPPAPSNDMYSLGCLIHMIHCKSGPPFSNHNSLQTARTNMDETLSRNLLRTQWRRLPDEVQSVLSQLLTRYPSSRINASSFLAHQYFSNLLVSTLNFLSRDAFNSQTTEAQTSFLKGLQQASFASWCRVLPRFSDKVNRRKVLPALLEETRKANLVPFLLPNILSIAAKMDVDAFRDQVLPSLKPLFALREPPQAVISLLDSCGIFVEKCSPSVFREEVMPLLYMSLESDNPVVLEKALKIVPQLSETLDYTTVKTTLFPKVATVFSKTTLLSVKVNTLICFHSMIKTLDKYTLTEKLVPLLAKIKTKEPAVMVATLAVHEAMGNKVEISAIATLILPQLWAMSMGPLLNMDQFEKFMSAIKRLGARVEEEHTRHLRELKRLEESNGANARHHDGSVDFETLVKSGGLVNGSARKVQNDLWADDSPRALTPVVSPPITPASQNMFTPVPSAAEVSRPTHSSRPSYATTSSRSSPAQASHAFSSVPTTPSTSSLQPQYPSSFPAEPAAANSLNSFASLQPSTTTRTQTTPSYKPNYNLGGSAPLTGATVKPQWNVIAPQAKPATMAAATPPGYNAGLAVLEPQVVARAKPATMDFAWQDFDPLK
ncbi:Protein kinase domain-containing protein ppk32 [Microbotryomycetes sp. JL201]|nr:Protein kinase domain-containing protein ppk32 [Microbotryomycetes sp. JL201]